MKYLFTLKQQLTLVFCLTGCIAFCQNFTPMKKRIPVQYSDFLAYVQVYEKKPDSKSLDNSKMYFWIKAKKIHSSKGGYEGDLLHGEYTALYKNDALKEKGWFKKGLKNGQWKEWYPNGELKSISKWKNGSLYGQSVFYNENGKRIQYASYKNGLLHGRQLIVNDTCTITKKFKNGKEVIKKPKRSRLSKKKSVDNAVVPKTNEEQTSSPKKKRNIFHKKSVPEKSPENKTNSPSKNMKS